jgi:hypothetical protein
MDTTPEARSEQGDERVAGALERARQAEEGEPEERLEALESAHALLEVELESASESAAAGR